MYEKIPKELKELNRWCCFKLVWDENRKKYTKLPYDAKTGMLAKSNDERTWSDFQTALFAIQYRGFDGLGFFFKEPYIGIDLDNVRNEIERYLNDDHENNIVSEFIDLLGSYAEISPSGNGVHIIVKGELPPNGRRKGNVEIYTSGRFFTMTGNIIGGYTQIYDDTDYGKIKYLHSKYIASSEPEIKHPLQQKIGNDLSIDEIIELAYKSKNGLRFKLFMEGGWEQFYPSQSEADLAFANDLAFWTNRDFDKMDAIFRRSSLMREKWDRKQNNSTYGAETLNKAIADCTNVFKPSAKDDDFKIYIIDEEVEEVQNKFYSYDDTGNAERFVDLFGDILRYSYIRKNWYYYNGKKWEIDQEGKIKKLADQVIEKMQKEKIYVPDGTDEEEAKKLFQRHLKYTRNHSGKTNMIKESEHLLSIQQSEFDNDIYLFNVQNGYLDLRTGTLHNHDKEKYFTKISNVEYTDKADCPMWKKFLSQIFDNNQEIIDFIQRAVGYSLCGSTEEQKMFILYGNGRNGKSVFLDIITELFGDYSANIQPQSIMVKPSSSNANPDIAKLAGTRLVTTTEPGEGMRFDEGLVKQITGGDKISARFLYEDEFEYIPQFKLWMATNHKPIIRGTDDGIWRRLVIIPFTVQIPEDKVDKKLRQKLKRELNAILHWAVEGFLKWQREGLKEPEVIKAQREDYRLEMDVVQSFINECCIVDQNESVQSSLLYQAYKTWAQENNQYLMNSTKFGREMSKRFIKFKSSGIYYKGIGIKKKHDDGFYFKLG